MRRLGGRIAMRFGQATPRKGGHLIRYQIVESRRCKGECVYYAGVVCISADNKTKKRNKLGRI